MIMNKYRFCNGLAIFPEHDMKMLSEMSRSGWHFVGFSGLMYKFEKGEPMPYIYSVNFEKSVGDDMLELYRESGWEPVVVQNGYQIFRAADGTPPIFSDKQSEIDIVKEQKNLCGRGALISLGILLVLATVLHLTAIHSFFWFLIIVPLGSFIFTFFPFMGSILHIRRIQKRRKENYTNE